MGCEGCRQASGWKCKKFFVTIGETERNGYRMKFSCYEPEHSRGCYVIAPTPIDMSWVADLKTELNTMQKGLVMCGQQMVVDAQKMADEVMYGINEALTDEMNRRSEKCARAGKKEAPTPDVKGSGNVVTRAKGRQVVRGNGNIVSGGDVFVRGEPLVTPPPGRRKKSWLHRALVWVEVALRGRRLIRFQK